MRLANPCGLYVITACMLLGACGQKGDLYIPTDSQVTNIEQAEEAHKETSPTEPD